MPDETDETIVIYIHLMIGLQMADYLFLSSECQMPAGTDETISSPTLDL